MNQKRKRTFNMRYQTKAYSYPYLYEDIKIVDFEIITDEIASLIAILYNYVEQEKLKKDLDWLCGITWTVNAALRRKKELSQNLIDKILAIYDEYENEIDTNRKRFTLPIGSKAATYCELIRNKFKKAVRELYEIEKNLIENKICEKVDDRLFDFLNICSNLFYIFSLWIRCKNNEEIRTFSENFYEI